MSTLKAAVDLHPEEAKQEDLNNLLDMLISSNQYTDALKVDFLRSRVKFAAFSDRLFSGQILISHCDVSLTYADNSVISGSRSNPLTSLDVEKKPDG